MAFDDGYLFSSNGRDGTISMVGEPAPGKGEAVATIDTMNLKMAVDLGGRPQALESIEVATASHFTNLVTTAVAVTAC